jgi:hypothetical protein
MDHRSFPDLAHHELWQQQQHEHEHQHQHHQQQQQSNMCEVPPLLSGDLQMPMKGFLPAIPHLSNAPLDATADRRWNVQQPDPLADTAASSAETASNMAVSAAAAAAAAVSGAESDSDTASSSAQPFRGKTPVRSVALYACKHVLAAPVKLYQNPNAEKRTLSIPRLNLVYKLLEQHTYLQVAL